LKRWGMAVVRKARKAGALFLKGESQAIGP